ncbi:MAG: nucleotidyltransferase domain-containing protein [candidate division Zixibacteria bacterium]|nr:nucleotidyltransferase domain-containing protein [candidate division Zixibacteria bacterium]
MDVDEQSLGSRIASLLESRQEVLEAYLFGSRARGGAQPHSDLDIAVYIDEAYEDKSVFGLRAELTTILMAGLRDNGVDLLILNNAPPVLYYHVLRDGVRVLSRDLAATTTREGRAVSRYCDFVPQLAKMEAARSTAARSRSQPE